MARNIMNNHDSIIYRERIKPRRLALLSLISLLVLLTMLAACQTEDQTEEPSRQPAGEMTDSALEAVVTSTATSEPTTEPATEPEPTQTTVVQDTTEPQEEPTATAAPAETVEPSLPAATSDEVAELVLPGDAPEGALVSVLMESQAGVLLDEIPEEYRETVAQALLDRPESFWEGLARRQVLLTRRRLNFRNFVYNNKGQLPLPPQELWHIVLDPGGPQRVEVGNGSLSHDLLAISYTITSTLLTDAASLAEAEPALAEVGGQWDEPFIFPLDPDLLLQRTDNACLNEAGFPPNSFDSENTFVFFDYTCQADSAGVLGCHRSRLPGVSCLEAMNNSIGTVETVVQFERLEWDDDLAGQVRVGEVTTVEGPDLKVVGSDLDVNRIVYRYFEPDSCALAEQCVSDSGWRRLLQFNGTVQNVGAVDLDIGAVNVSNPLNALFQYNSCHNHYHFSDYGDFYFAGGEQNFASKQAFCVESTDRISNNEWSPLTHSFTCRFQGVQAGWVDEYHAGLDCQWIDITDVEVPAEGISVTLGFTSNPDQFLCEGTPEFDEQGNPIWEPSGLETPDGREINRPACDFVPDWDVNNDDSTELFLLPVGGLVTEPCSGGQIGPLRNCGFSAQLTGVSLPEEGEDSDVELPEGAFACQPGQQVQLACSVGEDASPQVLRVCDFSHELGIGTACLELDALANEIVAANESEFSFSCPAERGEKEPGGAYTFYTSPLFEEDATQTVSCTVVE
jgi:hypothetical protein